LEIEREGTLPNSFCEASITLNQTGNGHNSKKITDQSLEIINSFGNVAGYSINIQKSVPF
jgi:hypothetical protein